MYVISAPGGRQDQLRLKTFDRLRIQVGRFHGNKNRVEWKIIQKNGNLRWIEWMIFLVFCSSQFIPIHLNVPWILRF